MACPLSPLPSHRRIPVGSQTVLLAVLCGFTAFAAEPATPSIRQYAPEREFDLHHLQLDITPDFSKRVLHGKATLRLQPLSRPLRQIHLDAVDLRIELVESDTPIQAWQLTTNQLVVTFTRPVPADAELALTIRYAAEPEKGIYWRTPELGYRQGETHLFSQGEAIEHRHWYPSFDAPNDRFTSEMTCRVPAGMIALSNGRLISKTPDPETGLVAFHWLQSKPHVNYLVALVAGFFERVEDRHGDIPLAFYTLPSEIDQAANSFRDTVGMMAFFEEEIGEPYPWDRYDQICVNDFVAGGMENTTLTVLTDRTLFTDATENIRSSEGLVAHELAHQWFGDLLTCKDWSQIWLNESFATYYETLYTGHRHGQDHLLYEMYERRRSLTSDPGDTRAIVRRTFASPDDMFDHLTYPKGSWVLHMLRRQLGDDLYRQCIRTYVDRHRFDTVVTEDLNRVLEDVTGHSWDRFFDQWIYHGGFPDLEVAYSWDEPRRMAKLSITQKQKLSDDVLLFHLPLQVRFKGDGFTVDQPLLVQRAQESFEVSLPGAPTVVRLDPALSVLARITLKLPDPMIEAQLQDLTDLPGRLLAVESLGERPDRSAVQLLQATLQTDPFYGVRLAASRALRSIHTDEALTALLASREQEDARVRRQVVDDFASFYREEVFQTLKDIVRQEENPAIAAEALQGLAGYPRDEVRTLLTEQLRAVSYRDSRTLAALRAARSHLDTQLLPIVLGLVEQPDRDLPPQSLAETLTTLGELGREAADRDKVRETLIAHLDHPSERVRLAALRGLGSLEDPQALPALDRFTGTSQKERERGAAERAIREIRDRRPPSVNQRNLRDEVLELRKALDELRKKLDKLEESGKQAPRR